MFRMLPNPPKGGEPFNRSNTMRSNTQLERARQSSRLEQPAARRARGGSILGRVIQPTANCALQSCG